LEGKDSVCWKVQVEHGKRQVFNIPKALLVEASLPFQHTWSGTQAIIGDEEVKLQQGNCHFSKTIKISWEINIPIMPSAPGFTQFNAVITNIDLYDSNTTCLDAHIIPEEEYLVNNVPTLDNQETTPENGTETTVETPEPHLMMQNLPGFDQLKYVTTNIEQFDSNIACFDIYEIPDEESLAKHSHFPGGIQDQNPSATNSAPNMPENGTKPTFKTVNLTETLEAFEAGLQPNRHLTETLKSFEAGLHLTETLKAFEAGLPPNWHLTETLEAFEAGLHLTEALELIKPMGQNVPAESTGPHLTNFKQFEGGLPQGDSQQVIKALRKISKRASPIELSISTTIHPQLNHVHASVCPMYQLNSRLQGGKNQTKWEQ
jgi:hypothetical protein